MLLLSWGKFHEEVCHIHITASYNMLSHFYISWEQQDTFRHVDDQYLEPVSHPTWCVWQELSNGMLNVTTKCNTMLVLWHHHAFAQLQLLNHKSKGLKVNCNFIPGPQPATNYQWFIPDKHFSRNPWQLLQLMLNNAVPIISMKVR